MSVADAYGGARFCIGCAREASDPLEQIDWLLKADSWRALGRLLRGKR
jgi:predicted Fe-S protein YdhL (DUF1289 family)